ncbi:PrgI family protein [Patescibacteria group bacterium]|nr:PrgI family protein [Patescibacteria group bacterium]
MQYAIPQFVDIEDRVIGPLTIRQFLFILGGGLITTAGYTVFDLSLFIFSGIILMGIACTFAFVKINGQKFEKFLVNFILFSTNPKVRLWAKDTSAKLQTLSNAERRTVTLKTEYKEEVTRSKLHELSVLLDTSARYYAESTEGSKDKRKAS